MTSFSSATQWLLFAAILRGLKLSAATGSYQLTATNHLLTPGVPEVVTLAGNASEQLSVAGLESSVRFVLIEVHTLHTNLQLQATSPQTSPTISGTSIGMVTMLEGNMSSASWSVNVKDDSTVKGENVSVMVLVQKYGNTVPVPGGCNQVFKLEIDPNMLLTPSNYQTEILFQWASIGTQRGNAAPSCETGDSKNDLTYDIYVSYVPSGDIGMNALFDVLGDMVTAEAMAANSQKIATLRNNGAQKSQVTVTSQRRQGAVYGVIVRDNSLGTAASYVATVTYACNFTSRDCDQDIEALDIVFTVLCGAFGLFLVFCGHHFLRTEMAVFGFLATSMVGFLLLSLSDAMSDTACLAIAMVLGIVGSLLWFAVWWWLAFPSISVLVPGLTAGYLIACTLFFTPFANLSWWSTILNYGLVFACVALLYTVTLLCSPLTLNIVSCSLVGAFCIVMVVAIPLQSSLKLIVLNAVRHATVSGYISVVVVAPFQTMDIILSAAWVALLIIGCAFQFYRQRGKPKFPITGTLRARRIRRRRGEASERPSTPVPDETAPLLGNQQPPTSNESNIQGQQRLATAPLLDNQRPPLSYGSTIHDQQR